MKKERKDWCKLPYKVLLDDRLTTADAVTYAVLADLCSIECKVSVKTTKLAELTGLSLRQIHYTLDRLKECGYIISKKSDGRKLIIAIEQVLPAPTTKQEQAEPNEPNKSKIEPTEAERSEALITMLVNKYPDLPLDKIHLIYSNLKSEALARVKDKSKLYSYLATAIKNFELKDDGFDADEYNIFWNNFD